VFHDSGLGALFGGAKPPRGDGIGGGEAEMGG